ncbi:hypothetical protein N8303_07410 [Gammaproteobacteria bacterium]|jgi:hypothetical protein|nr:hypothetical protein [Gammaproteobacteria bacterium]
MKSFTRKSCVITLTAILGLSAFKSIAQQNEDFSDAIRELDIMSNIFEAALEPRRDTNNYRPVSILDEASYLADQGMIFSFIQPGGRGMMAFIDIDDMPGDALAEMGINLSEMAREISTEVRRSMPNGNFPFSGGAFNSISILEDEFEEMEEMSEDIRDQQEEVRDLQRDMRDLQRELRNDDNDDAENAEIEARIEQLQAQVDVEMEELESQTTAYQSVMQEYRQDREQEEANRNEAAQNLIISTLCDYGNTLRSLQNDEHVTVVMQSFNDNLDQVYVFDYADVASCSSEEELLQSAIAYQM